jgi:hypothetical protein
VSKFWGGSDSDSDNDADDKVSKKKKAVKKASATTCDDDDDADDKKKAKKTVDADGFSDDDEAEFATVAAKKKGAAAAAPAKKKVVPITATKGQFSDEDEDDEDDDDFDEDDEDEDEDEDGEQEAEFKPNSKYVGNAADSDDDEFGAEAQRVVLSATQKRIAALNKASDEARDAVGNKDYVKLLAGECTRLRRVFAASQVFFFFFLPLSLSLSLYLSLSLSLSLSPSHPSTLSSRPTAHDDSRKGRQSKRRLDGARAVRHDDFVPAAARRRDGG